MTGLRTPFSAEVDHVGKFELFPDEQQLISNHMGVTNVFVGRGIRCCVKEFLSLSLTQQVADFFVHTNASE